ncbi:hypothetical protein EMIHUDRAFT_235232 [Emiliania huxleyi CCMP1516]|uniref:AP2/ERF domain-containing protein n=2 Tax=Emiliania huxleyi TaxID=2903 RepID=A0A0D3JX03_EMIH1|nr:hypothetical protein EMIHUDRAFT_235232 [Emiliania huxleyi CCMP1516]EOD28038.1 hypothetical protein EMIHUDRAFT_235232 [Emiliania huxleyi CCMP1516]|eukprot:XP_005780467.1 hypothetical protein EMIHUDRAFT_235232 [Emiliania huxleyi CCMP1516]
MFDKMASDRQTIVERVGEVFRRPQVSGRLVLIPAAKKTSSTGYKNVFYNRSKKKFEAKVRDGGKRVRLGYFETAEEAATAYARSEYGRADAAKLLQPRPAPTAAGAEAIRQAAREGLTLSTSSNSTGYKGVSYCPKERGSKKYKLEAKREGLTLATSSSSSSGYRNVIFKPKERGKKYELRVGFGGKQNFLGLFATAEEAALARARHLRDTTARLLEPPPQQAPPQGAAGPSEASSYEEEDAPFEVGGRCAIRYSGGALYPGEVVGFDGTSSLYSVQCDDGELLEDRAARLQARAAEQAARG